MNPDENNPNPNPAAAAIDVEKLLDSVAQQEASAAVTKAAVAATSENARAISRAYDFRNPTLLSTREMRKLRLHQEEFVKKLAGRLSLLLRIEFSLKLSGLQTITCGTLSDGWSDPSNLTMFKMEPLRGVSVLEIPPRLAASIVDRLMGGSGKAPENPADLSEIEKALLDQVVQVLLEEWCGNWSDIKELKPVILGSETNGRFVQIASADTSMLAVSLEAVFVDCTARIQFGIPFATVEAMIRQLTKSVETEPAAPIVPSQNQGATAKALPVTAAPAKPATKWNTSLDEIPVPITAEWQGLELTAREITNWKIGDVIQLDQQFFQKVDVRLADVPKFQGRPGMIAGQWAVELTQLSQR